MNGARSTFMRKGYWLTALAAIVLLAASPGTASAQSTGFSDMSSGTKVRARPPMGGPTPLRSTITVSAKAVIDGLGRKWPRDDRAHARRSHRYPESKLPARPSEATGRWRTSSGDVVRNPALRE